MTGNWVVYHYLHLIIGLLLLVSQTFDRINLEASLFVVGSTLVWLFVMITVSINVYQVSKIDPVEGLRYE